MNTANESTSSDSRKPDRGRDFVDYIISRHQADKGVRAALTHADNPATEYQCWDILAGFGVDLEHENQRLPFATVAAAIARAKVERNGTLPVGKAIARCYEEGNTSDQAKAKLRRLLACDSVAEVCRILRPLLRLIESKVGVGLDYASLLNDLLWFDHEESRDRIKARWAQSFYGTDSREGTE